jgi:hypothetical protein
MQLSSIPFIQIMNKFKIWECILKTNLHWRQLHAFWSTDIWSTDIWSTDIWSTDIWSTDIWSTDIWSTDIWSTYVWLTGIKSTEFGQRTLFLISYLRSCRDKKNSVDKFLLMPCRPNVCRPNVFRPTVVEPCKHNARWQCVRYLKPGAFWSSW